MSITIHALALGALSVAVASTSHAGVSPAPKAPAQSGQYLGWTGEIVSNSFTSGPFAESVWAVGVEVNFSSFIIDYQVLEEEVLAHTVVAAPVISTGVIGYDLTDTVPYVFENDNPGDAVNWVAEFATGEQLIVDLYDEEGEFFRNLGWHNLDLDGALLEEDLARIEGIGGTIEIKIIEFNRYVPAPGAWCLLVLAARRSRRRRDAR